MPDSGRKVPRENLYLKREGRSAHGTSWGKLQLVFCGLLRKKSRLENIVYGQGIVPGHRLLGHDSRGGPLVRNQRAFLELKDGRTGCVPNLTARQIL